MRTSMDGYIKQAKKSNAMQARFRRAQRLLSLLVIVSVFWGLKLTGITMAGEAFCGKQEHEHEETCIVKEVICQLEEVEGHTHDDTCLKKNLQCTLEETKGHTHTDACANKTWHCELEEKPAHTHIPECTTRVLVCTQEEVAAYHHSDSCYTVEEGVYTCGLEASEEHVHDDSCLKKTLTCTNVETEGHSHGDACYEMQQTCGLEETEGHTHTEECYTIEEGYGCGLEESEGHAHGDDCYTLEEGVYVCELEETEGHTHGDDCYNTDGSCQLEEHIHTENCYSDITADVETSDDWEESFMGLIRSEDTAENILMVARSQLGVQESILNFQVDEEGVRRGISRYGQWYGNPYADWSAMFASFCLEYAGVMEMPANAGPESMRLEWEALELYLPLAEWEPVPGQLLFLDKDQNGASDAVAIITGMEENVVFVIEGDLHEQVREIGEVKLYPEDQEAPEPLGEDAPDQVLETLYALDDPKLMGYGLVPVGPGLMLLPERPVHTVWLDGTNGGLMLLSGSPNVPWSASGALTGVSTPNIVNNEVIKLPETWPSPTRYEYKLRGWYDVVNNVWYAPGAEMKVNADMVLYADWQAASYDIGRFNNQLAPTISTNSFVTTYVFDYNSLFNVLSTSVNATVNDRGHSESWSMSTGNGSLDYIFRTWDSTGMLSYPSNTDTHNTYTEDIALHTNLYSYRGNSIIDYLFNPGRSVVGKQYLGTADHLFQLCTDPTDVHYGYYYYDSTKNAASYNQSDNRFYVYEYLERSSESVGAEGEIQYSDFLPMNSPYANQNGNSPETYSHNGVPVNYTYQGTSGAGLSGDFHFGMRVDIRFYLPNKPGETVDGGYGNQDVFGNDMQFTFSGDDDVWVFVDDTLVLDLGGIHGVEKGVVDFSTGTVTVDVDDRQILDPTTGAQIYDLSQRLSENLKSLKSGQRTLRLYYLERGSSQSNCAIYFNLAPRYNFSIQKEDVLTRNVLNGAQFSVFTDISCAEGTEAELWTSKASHDAGDASTNVFTVANGQTNMWGMGAGNTYYIKETTPPANPNYSLSNGIIRLRFNKDGLANYAVEMLKDSDAGLSTGFTVHGFRINEETQEAYIVATNAPETVHGTTSVKALKYWNDDEDHSGQPVTVYLTVKRNNTVTRIQEATLSDANNWTYTWTNLPKYETVDDPENPGKTKDVLIQYGVEEIYTPGYYSKVTAQKEEFTIPVKQWQNKTGFEDDKVYILKNTSGQALATATGGDDVGFVWMSEEQAKISNRARWVASVQNGKVRLTNLDGYNFSFWYGNGSPTDFFAHKQQGENNDRKQYFYWNPSGAGVVLSYNGYYVSRSQLNNGKFNRTSTSGEALVIIPATLTTVTEKIPVGENTQGFLVTNTPLDQETAVTVLKNWDYGDLTPGTEHEQAQITVKLLADEKDTGRTVTLNLKNNWQDSFRGLPLTDTDGRKIVYTVEEVWEDSEWVTSYGPITLVDGTLPTYYTTITNTYRKSMSGPILPSTGTPARMLYTLVGFAMMFGSLGYGIYLRRRRERRTR